MELIVISVGVLALMLVAFVIFLLRTKSNAPAEIPAAAQEPVARPVRRNAPPGARRRDARRRLAADQQREDSDAEEDEDAIVIDRYTDSGKKIGTKKMQKLQEKEEKRRNREAEAVEREEKKKRDEQRAELRRKEEEKAEALEAAKEEEEKKKKEEEEQREYEEYLKMKEAFTVEEEGQDVDPDQDVASVLQEFIDYIKEMKVVMLEDLASHFKLKTQNVIDRIRDLQEEGRLSGVMDDRGKFIYITQEEYEAVATFIRQRGRVSLTELAESSNKLINMAADNDVYERKLLGSSTAATAAAAASS